MTTPFAFGKLVFDKNFTNRKSEIEQLIQNFISLTHTIVISPRRWGKSSLVAKAAQEALKKDKSLRFCYIDLYNVRTEEEFYKILAQEVLRGSSSKMEELLHTAKKFMSRFMPMISFGTDANNEIKLSLDWKEVKKNPDEILNLCENIAEEKNIKFVICIDEFQNISEFDNQLSIQKKLRSHWQKHQNVAYCLYGSKRHMLMDVFTSASMPFYKFGTVLFLEKIKEKDWIPFIVERFSETGKIIDNDNAAYVSQLADYHPYYVQQLAQQCWFRTETVCTREIIDETLENLVLQLSLLFQNLTDELSTTHVNLLKAIIYKEKQLSSKEIIGKYSLGTSANVLRIKKALLKKEIIDINGTQISILDPIYQHWLKTIYFN
jgi:hypothetical protein